MISNIRSIGPKLIDLGYQVCAVEPGKKAARYTNWNKRGLTKEECASWSPDWGVGILCGIGENPVYCLDVDSYDPEVSQEFFDWVGDNFGFECQLYRRVGREPKYALVFRGSTPGRKTDRTGKWVKDGTEVQLEIIGASTSGLSYQFCAYHTHPDTHKPYTWPEISLVESLVSDLPVLSEEQMREAKDAFTRIIIRRGYSPETSNNNLDRSAELYDSDFAGVRVFPKLTIEQAREYLFNSGIDPSDYASWIKVGMALHNEFEGSYEALKLFDEWSSQAENYVGFEDCEKKWNSFKLEADRRVTMGSIIALYNKNTKNFDNELHVRALSEKVHTLFKNEIKKQNFTENNWYLFNRFHWSNVSPDEVASKVLPCLEQEFVHYIDEAPIPEQKKTRLKLYRAYLNNPVKYVRAVMSTYPWLGSAFVSPEDFDADSRYFGVANGDIDLQTGQLLPPAPERMISKFSPVDYKPEAKCPLWEKTLQECLVYTEVVEFFQRLIGYVALGDPKENKMVFLHGFGCNGKSTIMSVLLHVFGPYGVAMQPETLVSLGERRQSASAGLSPGVARLRGSRLALAEELTEGAKVKSEMLKRLAGTEQIAARELYQAPIEFKPTHTVFVCTNHLPKVADDSDGTWRRLILIGFPRSFDKDPHFRKDERLKEKLLEESPGILNWILQGAARYQKDGLAIPEVLDCDTRKWRGEEDTVGNWIDECLEPDEPGKKIPVREVYANFRCWASEHGVEQQSSAWLTRRLKERGYNTRLGAHKVNYLYGVKLREEEQEEW